MSNKIFPTWQKSQLECDGLLLVDRENMGNFFFPYDWGLNPGLTHGQAAVLRSATLPAYRPVL